MRQSVSDSGRVGCFRRRGKPGSSTPERHPPGSREPSTDGTGRAWARGKCDRVEYRIAGQRLGEHAREPAVGPERGRPRMARARTALVAVGVRDEADLVALLHRVIEEPLEPSQSE